VEEKAFAPQVRPPVRVEAAIATERGSIPVRVGLGPEERIRVDRAKGQNSNGVTTRARVLPEARRIH